MQDTNKWYIQIKFKHFKFSSILLIQQLSKLRYGAYHRQCFKCMKCKRPLDYQTLAEGPDNDVSTFVLLALLTHRAHVTPDLLQELLLLHARAQVEGKPARCRL